MASLEGGSGGGEGGAHINRWTITGAVFIHAWRGRLDYKCYAEIKEAGLCVVLQQVCFFAAEVGCQTQGAARLVGRKRGAVAKITIRANYMFHKQLIAEI